MNTILIQLWEKENCRFLRLFFVVAVVKKINLHFGFGWKIKVHENKYGSGYGTSFREQGQVDEVLPVHLLKCKI